MVQQHFRKNLLFKIYQVKEKYNKYQSLLLKTDTYESFVPDRYQDAHEYYVQLVNNLTELFDATRLKNLVKTLSPKKSNSCDSQSPSPVCPQSFSVMCWYQ